MSVSSVAERGSSLKRDSSVSVMCHTHREAKESTWVLIIFGIQ